MRADQQRSAVTPDSPSQGPHWHASSGFHLRNLGLEGLDLAGQGLDLELEAIQDVESCLQQLLRCDAIRCDTI